RHARKGRDARRGELRRQDRDRALSRRPATQRGSAVRRRRSPCAQVPALRAAAEARARRRRQSDAAAYPPRPRARLPHRRLAQMKRPVARTINDTAMPAQEVRAPRAFTPTEAKAEAAIETFVDAEPEALGTARP